MIGDKSLFSCLTSVDGGYVIYEDNGKVKLLVKGDTSAQFCNIHNVLLVDVLMDKLLSTSQLCDKCSEVIFESMSSIQSAKDNKSLFLQIELKCLYNKF